MHQILPHQEELKKNCGRIVERFCRPSTGRGGGEKLWNNSRNIFRRSCAKYFYNFSTILPHFSPPSLPDEGPQNLSTIFLQFFHNYSLLEVYPCEKTKILPRFCGRIVEQFGACQIRGRIFLTAAD
jgi:hypothetical protein